MSLAPCQCKYLEMQEIHRIEYVVSPPLAGGNTAIRNAVAPVWIWLDAHRNLGPR